ncbi:CcdB family protein, partial [Endothiovibrio diazotrophicus]
MAQFDVYRNTDPASAEAVPYLLDLQNDLLDPLGTRVVAPLIAAGRAGLPISRLTPVLEIEGRLLLLSIPELAGIPTRRLGPRAGSLDGH